MRMTRRLDVIANQAWLTDDNLGTDATAEYSDATTYAAGAQAKVTGTGGGAATATYKIYESLQAANTDNDPTVDAGTVSPGFGTWWKEVGSVNEWALFNDVAQDQSTKSGGFYVELTPGSIINAVSVFNVDALSFNITMTDPTEGEVFNTTYTLTENVGVDSWYEFFFEPIIRLNTYSVYDLPPYEEAATKITFNGTGDVSVGALVAGQSMTVGRSLKGGGISLIDYSEAEYIPTLGRTIIDKRDYAESMDFDVLMPKTRFNYVRQELISSRGKVQAWTAGDADIFGYMKDLTILLSADLDYMINIEIEGVT